MSWRGAICVDLQDMDVELVGNNLAWPCVTRKVEMWLPDGTQGSVTIAGTTYDEEGWNVAAGWYSRFSYNSVVDDRSRRPVFSPLCCCVDRCQVWDV